MKGIPIATLHPAHTPQLVFRGDGGKTHCKCHQISMGDEWEQSILPSPRLSGETLLGSAPTRAGIPYPTSSQLTPPPNLTMILY